jgi:quercetin dioxygenase-like cupin family protein
MHGSAVGVHERSPRAGDCAIAVPEPALDQLRKPIKEAEMTPTTSTAGAPISLGPGEGEALWFFGCLTTLKATGEQTGDRLALTDNFAPRGAGSPLHVHHREAEWFYVIEGELTLWVGGETIVAPAGSFVYGPQDIPHTFVVSSETARFLLGVNPAGFEGFTRALAEPAARLEIPPPASGAPDMERIAAAAASFGIDVIGPPGIPE